MLLAQQQAPNVNLWSSYGPGVIRLHYSSQMTMDLDGITFGIYECRIRNASIDIGIYPTNDSGYFEYVVFSYCMIIINVPK